MLSLIIPAKNEEKTLPFLFNSLKFQGIKNLEVIVADANSQDNTRNLILDYGYKIVKGGSPALGRNAGANISRGQILAFIDADGVLQPHFLYRALNEIEKRDLDVAATLHNPVYTGKKLIDVHNKISYQIANFAIKSLESTLKPTMHLCMFIRKKIHDWIGCFDEEIIFGEDSEYAPRAKKYGARFGVLRETPKILDSPRRLQDEGLKLTAKYIYFNTGRFLLGHEFRKNSRIKYF